MLEPPAGCGRWSDRAAWTSSPMPFRAEQQEQERRPPDPTARHTEPRSAAGAGAADRTRVGDRAHPRGRRTTRQDDGRRLPNLSAERHVSARSRTASMLGVGRLGPRREPGRGHTEFCVHRSSENAMATHRVGSARRGAHRTSHRNDEWRPRCCSEGTSRCAPSAESPGTSDPMFGR